MIIAQLHAIFLRLHNRVAQKMGEKGRDFGAVQRRVRWLYQRAILHDFLWRIVPEATYKRSASARRQKHQCPEGPTGTPVLQKRHVAVTVFLAHASARKTDTAEGALRLTQRADILLDQAQLNVGDLSGAGATVVLVFKNFGPTRAVSVVFHAGLITPVTPNQGNPVIGPITLGPNDTQRITFERFGEWMPEDTAIQIFSGKMMLQFYCEVTYQDIFGINHFTRDSGTLDHRSHTFRMDKHEAS